MTLHIFHELEQRSEEWYEARCGIVTASVVGHLLTPTLRVADNDTSRHLTRTLAAERITGFVEPTYQNDDMFRGVIEEPRAREHYSEHYAKAVECGLMIRDDWGYQLGLSPDGLVGSTGLVEVKSPRQKEHLRTILEDEVPPQYMAQCQAALLVSGRKWLDYLSWCPPMPMWRIRVTPDDQWAAAILAALHHFEEAVEQMVAKYRAVTEGLPATQRLDAEVEVTAS